ncbi:MAG: AgmX/PglI C-terminal domain-containing protein [Pseudobdellovibrio sp.]|nr:AgmX/PglI C-terminal domain-containing protein [Pseudobdellovibrio sp.]
MSILKITQTTHDGRTKVWKVDSKKSLLTFGSSRKSDFGSIDRVSTPFDAFVENRNDGWHFVSFDMKNLSPDLKIADNMAFEFGESKLLFNLIQKEEFVLSGLENVNPQITSKPTQKKLLIVSKNNKILRTEVKNVNHTLTYSIGGVSHTLPFVGKDTWEHHEIEGFNFKSKLVTLNEMTDIEKMPTATLVDKESKKMLIATLSAMFLFVTIGLFAPGKDAVEELTVPKSSSTLVMKLEMKVKPPKEKSAGQPSPVKNTKAAPSNAQNNPAPGGGKVSALLKGAIGVRISQLMGKVSATEARTAQVLVTAGGVKAGEADSGRALAAVGKVDSSGRNWNGEATANGGGKGVSTGGVGAGKGAGGMGTGLAAGKTGNGGVGLIEEESEVVGGLDREVIAQYIKSQLGQILYCYERQLSANPDLYGKVAVKFTIAGTGQVETQAINQTTLKSTPVEGCILNKIAKWKFPEPKGGTKVVVTYPFLFKSTN